MGIIASPSHHNLEAIDAITIEDNALCTDAHCPSESSATLPRTHIAM